MKPQKYIIAASLLATAAAAFGDHKQPEALKRVHEATVVFNEVMEAKDRGIPQDLLDKAHCAIIVPGMKHGGFIVGAKYGKGVLMCRKAGGGWRGPATIRLEGGSVGFQIGGGETDLVLLVMNERGAERLLKSEFKIGGEAAAMAGPVGRTVQADTDGFMRAQMLGYSRSRGVFAGIALEGSTLREDLDDNQAIYGKRLSNEEIMQNHIAPSPKAVGGELAMTLNRYSTWEKK
jgi:SH3 domain-containing YSC84-like protein 1